MDRNIKICDGFNKWLIDVLQDMIVNTMQDEPEKVPTLLLINKLFNELKVETMYDVDQYIGEALRNKRKYLRRNEYVYNRYN